MSILKFASNADFGKKTLVGVDSLFGNKIICKTLHATSLQKITINIDN